MRSKRKTFFGITAVVAAFIVLHYVGWLAPIENFVRGVFRPASQIMYAIRAGTLGPEEEFNSVEELQAAYADARQKLLDQSIDAIQMELLLAENQELREQLHFVADREYDHIGGNVIGKNIDPLESAILLDVGFSDGVRVGNPVIAGRGILVGVVATVWERTSIVRLVNDSQSKVAATVMNRDKSIGLVEGGFGISVQMNFIPQNEQIDIGDAIITSGLTKEIPRGLLIGAVEAVEREAYQPFQRAVVAPALDLDAITVVSVVAPLSR